MAQLIPIYKSTSGITWNNSNTLTINKPSGVVEGDLMIAQVSYDTFNNPTSEPSGWTRFQIYTPLNEEMALYWKIAGASEPTNYSWTFNAAATACGGGITRIENADPVAPILWNSFNTGESNSMTYPGQTGLVGTFGVFGFGFHNDAVPAYSIEHYAAFSPDTTIGLCAGRQTLPNSGTISDLVEGVSQSGNWMASRVVVKGLTEEDIHEGCAPIMMGSPF